MLLFFSSDSGQRGNDQRNSLVAQRRRAGSAHCCVCSLVADCVCAASVSADGAIFAWDLTNLARVQDYVDKGTGYCDLVVDWGRRWERRRAHHTALSAAEHSRTAQSTALGADLPSPFSLPVPGSGSAADYKGSAAVVGSGAGIGAGSRRPSHGGGALSTMATGARGRGRGRNAGLGVPSGPGFELPHLAHHQAGGDDREVAQLSEQEAAARLNVNGYVNGVIVAAGSKG